MYISYVEGTCSMGELVSLYVNELLGPAAPAHPCNQDRGITFIIANTSDTGGAKICKFLGFKPLTKYKSNGSHQKRQVIVWGREMHRNSPEEKDFIDRQIYAKAMKKMTGYRSDWREFYAKRLVTKKDFIESLTERMNDL